MPRVVDALGREVVLEAPARRVVSLVPSETESVAELAGLDVLAGRTEWCEEPAGRIERVPTVGGTKKLDVQRVLALEPDLVLANQEENGRAPVERLIEAGATVHVSFPKTVPDALSWLRTLCVLLGVDPDAAPVSRARRAAERAMAELPGHRVRVFVPIWYEPWMTFDGRAFGSDLLELCGAHNVFSDRPRRYPLAADLGRAEPLTGPRVAERDTRYPRLDPREIEQRAPEAILLPDEPYRFGEREAAELRALDVPAAREGAVRFISGKDLFWYGTRLAGAIERLRCIVTDIR